jgi:hypothetical protein
MPVWIDDNTIQGELPVSEYSKEAVRLFEESKRLCNYIVLYEENLVYKSIHYQLKVICTCTLFPGTKTEDALVVVGPSRNLIGKHVVVERHGVVVSHDLESFLGEYNLLWRDTCQQGFEDYTLKQQWEWVDTKAKEDCEKILKLQVVFSAKVEELRELLTQFTEAVMVASASSVSGS